MPHSDLRADDITILIDTREKKPFEFPGIKTERATLKTGDYTIKGLEQLICIERKSLPDLIQCVGVERKRFDEEIMRMKAFKCRAVVIEAHWDNIDTYRSRSGKLGPNTVKGSIESWIDLGIPFFFHQDRQVAAEFTARLMLKRAKRCFRMLRVFKEHLKLQS